VPQPEVASAGGGAFRCGGWTASVDDAAWRLQLDGGGADPYDALRALCAAAWTAAAGTVDGAVPDATKVLAELGL
jgi:glycerol-1-phosphatase